MTEIVRKKRRWLWGLGLLATLLTGCAGGAAAFLSMLYASVSVACPPLFRPTPEELPPTARGSAITLPRAMHRPTKQPPIGGVVRVRGQVISLARVEKDGSVSRAEVINSSGFCPYDVQAVKDVRNWKFQPARRLGEAFASWVPVTLNCSLQRSPQPKAEPLSGANI